MRVDVRKLKVIAGVSIAVGVLLFPADRAEGKITVTGDVTPAYDGSSTPWNVGGDLIVGNTGDAEMTLLTGEVGPVAQVTDVDASMACLPGSSADVSVSGVRAFWQNTDGLYIGGTQTQAGGTALLTIRNNALVQANQVVIWGGGALLGGNGTLRAPSVTSWGTMKGSDTISTLTIDGNLTFQPGSVLEVQVANEYKISWTTGPNVNWGGLDPHYKIVVTGDVNIIGGTVKVFSTSTITGTQEFAIIDANSVTGTFNTFDTALLDLTMVVAGTSLEYTDDQVIVRITANAFDEGIGTTPNQQSFGAALQAIVDVNASGTPITAGLQQLPTLAAVRNAYDQLDGQSRPPLASIVTTDSAKFMGIIANRLQGARGGVARDLQSLSDSPLLAMAEPQSGIGAPADRSWDNLLWDLSPGSGDEGNKGWGTWGKAYGVFGNRDTEDGVTGYSFNVFGQNGGVDIQFSDRFTGGATGGHSRTQVDYDTLADEAEVGTTYAGLYSTYSGDGWYLNSLVTRSWINVHTERVVDLTSERHTGDFDGREWSGYVEFGFDWQPAQSWLIQPLTAFQYTRLHLDQYAENGYAGALVYEDQQYKSYKLSMGVKVTKELLLDTQGHAAIVQARGRLVHEFNETLSSVQTRFEDVPGIFWTVSDSELPRDSVMLGVGAGVRLTKGLRAFVDYDASFSSDDAVHVISGALDYRW